MLEMINFFLEKGSVIPIPAAVVWIMYLKNKAEANTRSIIAKTLTERDDDVTRLKEEVVELNQRITEREDEIIRLKNNHLTFREELLNGREEQ